MTEINESKAIKGKHSIFTLLSTPMSDKDDIEYEEVEITGKLVLCTIGKMLWCLINFILFMAYFAFCVGGVWVSIGCYALAFALVFSTTNPLYEALFVAGSIFGFLSLSYFIYKAIRYKEIRKKID